jgi:hypothetical protein
VARNRPCGRPPVGAEKNRCDREAARSSIVRPEDRPGALHTGRVPAVVPLVRHSSVPAVPSVAEKRMNMANPETRRYAAAFESFDRVCLGIVQR